ncbi:MAG TPA: DUF2279 domain-containing protein [Bacteroidia bacterium]|nr:DUF2279 domain-containing protein [Bacteroidia bacterium]
MILKFIYKKVAFFFLFILIIQNCFSQAADTVNKPLTTKQKTIRKSILLGTTGAYTTASLIGLNQIWYKQYASSKFHFFNDNNEWCQMDKLGHTFTTYNTAREIYRAMLWAGYNRKQSIFIGEAYGTAYMTAIEIMDGFSSGWGFSWGDEVANVSGSALFTLQQYFWNEQRIHLKYSFHQTFYAGLRPSELGTSLGSQTIKDYNGQTYWLSVSPASFFKKERKFPKWIAFAFGYGATGMVGGYSNVIVYPNGTTSTNPVNDQSIIIGANGVPAYYYRYRKFYFSLDIDFTKIKTKSKFLQSVFSVFNGFKLPFPAIEFDKHGVNFKPFYF